VIPRFDDDGNLPPGVLSATWKELAARYGNTMHRQRLLDGLLRALRALRAAGCKAVYINGSFVTDKVTPNDFDGCWDLTGVDLNRLDPVLQDIRRPRVAQKTKYFGELFPAHFPAGGGKVFLDFFQTDRDTGKRKGIVVLDLGGLP